MMIFRSREFFFSKAAVYLFLMLLLQCAAVVAANKHKVPVAEDFSELGQQAEQKQVPILLMVSQDHCPFCQQLKSEVLNPMMISGDYDDKVIITELLIDVGGDVKGFDGKPVYPGKIASEYSTWVTPTLLFLDHQGTEVHKRMLGVNTIEMYGYYLDESLAAALTAIRQGKPYRYQPGKKDTSDKVGHGGL